MTSTRMTAHQARDHLARLGLSQQGFARLVRVNPVTVRRWLQLEVAEPAEIPRSIEILLELMTPAIVRRLVKRYQAEP